MINLVFIRHGATLGNTQKRYIGLTDEPILEKSINSLKQKQYLSADIVYVSPMLRCKQTAQTIYPNIKQIVVEDLKECNFGKFEGKNFKELSTDTQYKAWIDSNGTLPFPNGEALESFKNRCIQAFLNIINKHRNQNITIALVVHGGTIMSIFEYYSENKSTYYDWHVENESGYKAVWKNNKLCEIEKI